MWRLEQNGDASRRSGVLQGVLWLATRYMYYHLRLTRSATLWPRNVFQIIRLYVHSASSPICGRLCKTSHRILSLLALVRSARVPTNCSLRQHRHRNVLSSSRFTFLYVSTYWEMAANSRNMNHYYDHRDGTRLRIWSPDARDSFSVCHLST